MSVVESAHSQPVIICDVPEHVGTGLPKWITGTPLKMRNMGVQYPRADFALSLAYVKHHIEKNCGLKMEVVTEERGNLECYFKRIDRPQGVLARFWLPDTPSYGHGVPGRAPEMRPGEWDSWESDWLTQRPCDVVTLHELCHGLGLGHCSPSIPSIMNPTLNTNFVELDEWTIGELQMRYGPPNVEPLPPEPPPPAPPTAPGIDWIKLLIMLIEWWTAKKGGTLTAAEISELEAKAKELVG